MVGQIDIGYLAGVQIFGKLGGKIMGLGISVLLLSTVSSYIYIGPRIMQTMGEDHWFLKKLKYKNSKDIPINAFFVQLILSSLFLCLEDALNRPKKKNTAREAKVKPPKKIVLISTIDFLVLLRALKSQGRAKSGSPLMKMRQTIPYISGHFVLHLVQ